MVQGLITLLSRYKAIKQKRLYSSLVQNMYIPLVMVPRMLQRRITS